jgi:hypothetical protein
MADLPVIEPSRRLGKSRPRQLAHRLFIDPAGLLPLIAISATLTLPGLWMMLSLPVVYSREMTWDLLFNLDGAWRLFIGQTAHVDFHDPVGTLSFAATTLGFHLVGVKPFAFIVGEVAVASVSAALAILAAKDRLALAPAVLFIALSALLPVLPVMIGDLPNAYTSAMAYNRFGWSLTGILFLILFVEPHDGAPAMRDAILTVVVMTALYYIKITYFCAAYCALVLALSIDSHVRRKGRYWWLALAAVSIIALAPFNLPYIRDIADAIGAGSIRTNIAVLLRNVAFGGAEASSVIVAVLVLVFLWLNGRVSAATLAAACFIFAAGLGLISQNAQFQGIPIYVIPPLLISQAICRWLRDSPVWARHATPLLIAPLAPLAFFVFYAEVTLFGYHSKIVQSSEVFVVANTNLQGLAVPRDLPASRGIEADRSSPAVLSSSSNGLTQYEYVQGILDLAAVLRSHELPVSSVVVLDQVNPLPFAMGAVAQHGSYLWWGNESGGWLSPETLFGQCDYIAIPHFPTDGVLLGQALDRYQSYFAAEFTPWHESQRWTVIKRRKEDAQARSSRSPPQVNNF